MNANLPATVPPATFALALDHGPEGDRFRLAEAYLASLRTETGRRGMKSAIRRLAAIYLEMQEPDEVPGEPDEPEIQPEIAEPGDPDLPLWSSVPWHLLSAAGVDALLARVEGAPATRNKALAALRGIARAGFRLGVIGAETYVKIRDTRGVRGSREVTGRDIREAEVEAILDACRCDPRLSARRDAAMIAFAVATGARREEIVRLTLDKLRNEATEHGPAITGRLIGKGDKERTFYVFNSRRDLVQEWLALRGPEAGFVFCRTNKRGEILPARPISTTSAHRSLIRRAKQAGVPDVAWHNFRRTVAGDLLDHGVDIATVAAILGHASVTTTQRYDRRGERAKKAALARR